ncbi:MAG: hypothetical protein LBU32_21200 [Clostridiales bacterium]|nr:hypothetical protein [Clostridiales bacterium]
MDIMDTAKQAEEGAARKLLKENGLSPARKCWLKYWISVYTAPPPGFIGMLSIQEGGLRAPPRLSCEHPFRRRSGEFSQAKAPIWRRPGSLSASRGPK